MLTTGAARQALARRCPQRYAELSATAGPEALDDAARQIVLYHLDTGWADHLAALASIREGIHLRALGRGLNPLDEFHREAVTLFSSLLRDAEERSAQTFQAAPITDPEPIWGGWAEAAHRDLDLSGAGEPVRHRHRPGPAERRPPAARLTPVTVN